MPSARAGPAVRIAATAIPRAARRYEDTRRAYPESRACDLGLAVPELLGDAGKDRGGARRLHEVRVESGALGPVLVERLAVAGQGDQSGLQLGALSPERLGDGVAVERRQPEIDERD